MNHRQRMQACLKGETIDRPPVALWRHFPVDDQSAEMIAAAHLHFQQSFDWDFLKVTPSSGYFVYDWGVQDVWRGHPHGTREYTNRVIHAPEDWLRLEPLSPHKGHLAEQITALTRIIEAIGKETPVIFTVFNPLSIAKKLVGDEELLVHLRQYPDETSRGLEVITEACKDFVTAVIGQAGADGIFFAVQHAQPSLLNQEEYFQFGRPYDVPTLLAASDGWLNVLHLHGNEVYFDQFTDYPVQVINWHDLETKPDLASGMKRFSGAVCGGIRQEATLNLGTAAQVRAESEAAMAATGGERFILGTGCVAPTTTPYGNLMAARRVVEGAQG
jgi:uroporphyrinogen decarboxylase